MANNSKSADRLDPAPRASTQKNYAETSPEVAKRGNQTRRTEETDTSVQEKTFENTDYLKKGNPNQQANSFHNADEEEEEESDFDEEDDSDLDEDEESDFDDEDEESDFDEDEDDEEE